MRDPRYYKGIDHFNARAFYDAHEIWEELWHEENGEAHDFIQGLIQFATALHHFEAHNLKGTRHLYDGGVELLTPYAPRYWEMNVKKLLDDMNACVRPALAYDIADLPGRYHPDKKTFPVQIQDHLVPKIELSHAEKTD